MSLDIMLREDYPVYLHSPEYIAIEMPRYLPLCHAYNLRMQLISISIESYLKELPSKLLIRNIAKQRLEDHIDYLSRLIYIGQSDGIVSNEDRDVLFRAIDNVAMAMLNVGDELWQQLERLQIYTKGGYHTYEYYAHPAQNLIVLKKMSWEHFRVDLFQVVREYADLPR